MAYVWAALGAFSLDTGRMRAEKAADRIRSTVGLSARGVSVEQDAGGFYYISVRVDPGVSIPSLPSQIDGVPVRVQVMVAEPIYYPSDNYGPYYGGPYYGGRRRHHHHHRRHHHRRRHP